MLLSNYFNQKHEERRAEIYSALLHHEARLGGKLFGSIPKGHRREFFCLDEKTWVWHEEWQDETGEWHTATTRYDVRPGGILKTQGNQPAQLVTGQEYINFYVAVRLYCRQMRAEQEQMLAVA